MARQRKVLPAREHRDRSRDDESILMRSAESLGRMIGSLQRQLDGATRRVSATADDVMDGLPDIPFVGGDTGTRKGGAKKSKSAARTRTAARKSTAGTRTTKQARTRASKSARKR